MAKKFIVRHRDVMPKEDKSVTMSLRLDRSLQAEYDQLALKSGRSRNVQGAAIRHGQSGIY